MKKFIIQIILIIIVLSIIIIGIMYLVKKQDPKTELENNYENFKEESTMYDENATIDDLKEEYNIEGNSELYEIQTEYDGRKVLSIKANENYKVAFAGLIKKSKPTIEEATQIFSEQHPTQNGIWIEPESREKIANDLNELFQSKYKVDEKGYLVITEYQSSENDEILKQMIEEEKQYVFGISGTTYYIDALTGEIFDNPYEEFDKTQPYSYFTDGNKAIIYITENKDNHLEKLEIYESILKLISEME